MIVVVVIVDVVVVGIVVVVVVVDVVVVVVAVVVVVECSATYTCQRLRLGTTSYQFSDEYTIHLSRRCDRNYDYALL